MPPKTSFEQFASLWDSLTGEGEVASAIITEKVFFKLLGNVTGKNVYEVACGNGYLARKFQQKGANDIWASDVSQSLIDIAKKKSKGITYLVQDGKTIKGIPIGHFDIVIIHRGIAFIKDLDVFLQRMHKLLKPGGILIFNAWHPLYSIAMLDMGKAKKETKEIVANFKQYRAGEFKKVDKKWLKNEVSFWQYKRSISEYINTCIKNGFTIKAFIEPQSMAKFNGKVRKSPIPSTYIIEARKI